MAVGGRQRVAEPPPHDESTVHVNQGIKIHESSFHRYVGNIRAPHLVRPHHFHASQQLRVYVLRTASFRETFLRIYSIDSHYSEQSSDPLLVNHYAHQCEHVDHRQHSCRGMLHVVLVHFLHYAEILFALSLWFVVERAAVELQQFAEPVPAQACGAPFLDLYYLTFSPASSQALAKKSHSIVISPTFFSNLSLSDLSFFSSFLLSAGFSKACAAVARNSAFHSTILPGATSNRLASSAIVSFSLIASMATFALRAGVNLLIRPCFSSVFCCKGTTLFRITNACV